METAVVVKKSPQSISFNFPAPRNDGGLPITRYHVKYNDIHEGHVAPESWIRYSWPANSPYYFLNGLKANTLYEFRFTAENDVGQGPESEALREELPSESQPEPVTIIQDDPAKDPNSGDVLSRYSRSFTLKWTEPQDNGKRIQSYDIKWYKVMISVVLLLVLFLNLNLSKSLMHDHKHNPYRLSSCFPLFFTTPSLLNHNLSDFSLSFSQTKSLPGLIFVACIVYMLIVMKKK